MQQQVLTVSGLLALRAQNRGLAPAAIAAYFVNQPTSQLRLQPHQQSSGFQTATQQPSSPDFKLETPSKPSVSETAIQTPPLKISISTDSPSPSQLSLPTSPLSPASPKSARDSDELVVQVRRSLMQFLITECQIISCGNSELRLKKQQLDSMLSTVGLPISGATVGNTRQAHTLMESLFDGLRLLHSRGFEFPVDKIPQLCDKLKQHFESERVSLEAVRSAMSHQKVMSINAESPESIDEESGLFIVASSVSTIPHSDGRRPFKEGFIATSNDPELDAQLEAEIAVESPSEANAAPAKWMEGIEGSSERRQQLVQALKNRFSQSP